MVIKLLKFCNYCNDLLWRCVTIMHCVALKEKFISVAKKKTQLTPAFAHFTVA